MLFQSDRKSRQFQSGFPFREACNFFDVMNWLTCKVPCLSYPKIL